MKLSTGIVEFDLGNKTHRAVSVEEFQAQPLQADKIYWIHCNLEDKNQFQQIAKIIDLPEEVLKLCRHQATLPKLIDLDQTLTVKFQCLREQEFRRGKQEHYGDLIVHLTNRFCFTAAQHQLPAMHEFVVNYPKAIKFAKTTCFILFLILDNAVNDYAQFLFNFEIMSDQMDAKVRENHENIYNEIVAIKRRVMEIKRCTVGIREILMRLSGRKISVISDDCRVSLINLFNQSQMIFNEIDSIREMLNGMLSQIDYSLMHKMNETMRVLTAFAAIFLPLTVITGIYGMNFHNMPELGWQYGYYFALGLLVVCGCLLYLFFKKKRWI